MVSNLIKNVFGLEPLDGINVDEAVALGAAIYAANQTVYKTGKSSQLGLPGLPKIVDVTNHSLGMIAVNSDRSAYLNSIILSKNKEIPCIDRRPYQYLTRRNRDNFLEIFMTQGESINPQDAYYLGKYIIRNIPHQQSAITVINISYSYNSSGMVEVTAQLKNSTKMLEVEVEKLPLDIPDRFLGTPDLNRAETLDHITAYLAFDLSGSMRGKPLLKAKEAAMSFLLNTDLSHCSLGIIAFSNKVNTKLVACQNARDIEYAINNLQVGETGYGNLAHPFNECFTLLNKLPNRKFIITLADGVWTNQKRAVTSAQKCHKADINIIAIGFGSADKLFLRAIASSNEASFFTTLNDLEETFSSIAQELTETGGLSLTNKG